MFPLSGERVANEYVMALRMSGLEWSTHHLDFVHKAGLNPMSGSARSHRRISDAMAAFQQIDQLNLPALLGVEILMRYLVQIETAVSRNPKCPDYADLDGITGALISESGTLVLPNYQKYVANIQRDEAFAMKQRRLWQEEQKPPTGQGGRHPGNNTKGDGKGKKDGKRGGGGGADTTAMDA